MRFVDLFAGLGGFHLALRSLGHQCVFACEIDEELQSLYKGNFPDVSRRVFGDIRISRQHVPPHDILCAGFPCQPFSKSGTQVGWRDRTRGTLFHDIMLIVKRHEPRYVLLENVGNFERHKSGRTWQIVRESLEELGYHVRGTEHKASGGHGLISPHHRGFPHSRERFFVVASLEPLSDDPFPRSAPRIRVRLRELLERNRALTVQERDETALSIGQVACIEHWNRLLKSIPPSVKLPSFPIWGDELKASYPFAWKTPFSLPMRRLRRYVRTNGDRRKASKEALLGGLPSYARDQVREFAAWKVDFIRQNRRWFRDIRQWMPRGWPEGLSEFAPSQRKLEWNCQGESRDLWRCVLQFRPSGLRAKRYTSIPALVAMTTTQIPILGPKRRALTRIEGLRLQGFPDSHGLPRSRDATFAALGNAVHVGVVRDIVRKAIGRA